jgi:hypothetical protein
MEKLCIDLCSGKGGISQAFDKEPNWFVVRVDVERKFKPTIIADVCHLPLKQNLQPEIMLAGPSCERFSVACHSWPRIGIKKAMELVGACFEAVAYLKPKHWLIENPMGRLRWFLGKPPMTLRLCDYGSPYRKLTDLWGNIALPLVNGTRKPTAYVYTETHMNAKHPLPQLKNQTSDKAKMPYGLSQAILECVDT